MLYQGKSPFWFRPALWDGKFTRHPMAMTGSVHCNSRYTFIIYIKMQRGPSIFQRCVPFLSERYVAPTNM